MEESESACMSTKRANISKTYQASHEPQADKSKGRFELYELQRVDIRHSYKFIWRLITSHNTEFGIIEAKSLSKPWVPASYMYYPHQGIPAQNKRQGAKP